MKKNILIFMLILTMAALALTACTKDKAGAGPAVLEGQSEHWKVKLEYTSNGDALAEAVTVQTNLTRQTMDEVTVMIHHKDQEPVSFSVIEPEMLKSGQPLTFANKTSVENWKDTEEAVVEWKIGGRVYKEYVTVENKSANAPKK
ncbi:MAG: hypothetical protein K0S39_1847 [Paenibacillus sp.]|jgi:hypothetical protein|nr:hypothetical protein [Paenibacillus sp.]